VKRVCLVCVPYATPLRAILRHCGIANHYIGLFFGFAYGMGGLGAALLGVMADRTGIEYVYNAIAYLPLLGVVAAFLPRCQKPVSASA